MKLSLKERLLKNKKKTAPVSKLIGMRIVTMKNGKARLTLKAAEKHLNTLGTVHGGILCDLSDAAMGYAFTSLLEKDQVGMTVEFKINFLKPVYAGEMIKAVATVISHGKTLSYLECEMRNPGSGLVAKASSTCKVL